MQFRLVVPPVAPAIRQLSLAEWTKQPGDPIAFGDEICVLSVGAKEMLQRDAPARQRVRAEARRRPFLRRRPPEGSGSLEKPSGGVILRVRASDEGILRAHRIGEGDAVEPGTLLGIVSTSADEPVDPSVDPTGPAFRAIAESDSSASEIEP